MLNLKNNMLAKILSLVGAIFLWLYIMNEENPMTEVNYVVPVSVVNLDSKYLAGEVPTQIKVKLRAPRNSFLGLQESALQAYLDLSGLKEGEHKVPIKFIPPTGMYVENQEPLFATVMIDEYAVREVPVEFKAEGKLDKDLRIKETKVVPSYVVVSGPKHLVDKAHAGILSISTEGKTEEFSALGNITVVDQQGAALNGLEISPHQGQAHVVFEEDVGEKLVRIQPILNGKPGKGYVLEGTEVMPDRVKISGRASVLKDITTVETETIEVDGAVGSIDGFFSLKGIDGVEFETSTIRVMVDIRIAGGNNAKVD